jgi:Ca2+/H+ antiporter, TMEM165/GDT1 family
MIWAHAVPTAFAAFLASTVEATEALTIILAVGTVRGWRDAIAGSTAALAVLLAIVVIFGSALTRIPLDLLQLVIGALLLLFGLRWLRKAILRRVGLIPLHNEATAFAKHAEAMRRHNLGAGWDRVAFLSCFQITMLEGTEVVFIVIAIGATGSGLLAPASLGACAAVVLVGLLGLAIHRPLAMVPENSLKFMVGVLLSAFGTFWVGEGMGIAWPGEDWSLLGLITGFFITACLAIRMATTIFSRRLS